jgi:hypothetical protein
MDQVMRRFSKKMLNAFSLTKDCIIVEFPELKHKLKPADPELARSYSISNYTLEEVMQADRMSEQNAAMRKAITDRIILLADIQEITFLELDPEPFKEIYPHNEGHIFSIVTGESSIYFRTPQKVELANWVLAIDGLKTIQTASSMSSPAKVKT